ncbi:MAG: hypothetical protein CMP21_06530 [Rickettsiales bacterium]|nr:hypothetical protein [Rickettsiales bacterium]|tara:strand:- start:15826 stop:17235 length:1410 start_codon:yes stop_codon:yes gene_type:complete
MFLFYDFETSSREFLGQIISYAFVLTDTNYEPLDSLTGKIKLNRTQCPEVKAILTNKINVLDLQKTGTPEYEAAQNIFNFFSNLIKTYNQITLIGFNSNNFDLSFLRNILVRYGFNPYFNGKLKNIDILHWLQNIAFYNEDNFPWVLTENNNKKYYSFRLEDITQASGLLTNEQSHDAFEDVILTIKLVTYLEQKFNQRLSEFKPILLPENMHSNTIIKQRYRDFPENGSNPEKYIYRYFYTLILQPKSLLMINLKYLTELLSTKQTWESITEEEKLSCIQYINSNKHFFVGESCTETETESYQAIIPLIEKDSLFQSIQQSSKEYFQLIKKEWDIEYQIHEIGFDHHIDTLNKLKHDLFQNPESYPNLLQELLSKRTSIQDNYLIQLFNRLYLNISKNPDLTLLNRYLKPRYITKEMYRNQEENSTFDEQQHELEETLKTCTNENDIILLNALKEYYNLFRNQLTTTV